MLGYIRLIVRYRFIVMGLLLLVTTLSGGVLSTLQLSGSLVDLFLGASPKYERYQERVKTFGSDVFIIIAFEEDNLLSKASIEKLQTVVREIEGLSRIKKVKTILDLQEVQIIQGMPVAEKLVDIALRQPGRANALIDKLRTNPLVSGLLISEDGRHSMVVCELKHGDDRNDQNLPPLLDRILGVFEKAGFDRAGLHQAGQIPILVEMMKQAQFNLLRLFPIVCLVLFITVYILFQRAWPVLITLIVTIIGVMWTTAVAVLLFGQINVMTAMTPGIIFIIAFSDVVHLCSSYHMEISKGERKEQAIEKSCSEVGSACLYTSITTFFGFISIALAPAPVTRQMGVVLGVGVGLALFIAMTLTPIIFSLMKAPKPMRVGAASSSKPSSSSTRSSISWSISHATGHGSSWPVLPCCSLSPRWVSPASGSRRTSPSGWRRTIIFEPTPNISRNILPERNMRIFFLKFRKPAGSSIPGSFRRSLPIETGFLPYPRSIRSCPLWTVLIISTAYSIRQGPVKTRRV